MLLQTEIYESSIPVAMVARILLSNMLNLLPPSLDGLHMVCINVVENCD
jgi:hypothetical protein